MTQRLVRFTAGTALVGLIAWPYRASAGPPAAAQAPTSRTVVLAPAQEEDDPAADAARLAVYGVRPPLSIYEAGLLLRTALEAIDRPDHTPPPTREEAIKAEHLLRAASRYVVRVDAAHSTLPHYRWTTIGSEKITAGGVRQGAVRPPQPLDNVTAVALRAHNGDVLVGPLVVVDADGAQWSFHRVLTVAGERPAPEVCFIPTPIRLAEVRFTYQARDPQAADRPRLFVEAGICLVSESGKQAVFEMQLAREALRRADAREAAAHIRRAMTSLAEFQRSRRL